MQTYLNAIGAQFPSIPQLTVDGDFGPMTRDAVVAFQRQFGLSPDGVIGPLTWEAIVEQYALVSGGAPPSPFPPPATPFPGTPLSVGSRGADVSLMQTYLNGIGKSFPVIPQLTVDGIFGPLTRDAVTAFQRRFGLTPDGDDVIIGVYPTSLTTKGLRRFSPNIAKPGQPPHPLKIKRKINAKILPHKNERQETNMGKTIVITNRKVREAATHCRGKSTTAANLGIGLARQNKRVLIIDADSQSSLTISLGVTESDRLPVTLATVMSHIINETEYDPTDGIIHHAEGIDLLPANNSLARIELDLASLLVGRDTVLRQYIETVKPLYDYIIVDTASTLGLLTVNALAATDNVIIPVTPKFLDAKGLELLLKTISQIKRQINPNLEIGGILLTMVETRANFTREIISLIEGAYGGKIHIFGEHIPRSIRNPQRAGNAAETSAYGKSIFLHDPKGKAAAAYANGSLARRFSQEEVLESA